MFQVFGRASWPLQLEQHYQADVLRVSAQSAVWFCAVVATMNSVAALNALLARCYLEALHYTGVASAYWFGPARVARQHKKSLGIAWLAANFARAAAGLFCLTDLVPYNSFVNLLSRLGDPTILALGMELIIYGSYQQVSLLKTSVRLWWHF